MNSIMFYYMAKNSMKQIEEDENKILQELANNSNKSINEIAKKCGFSRQKVWRMIKNLEKTHTIWGYTTIINKEKQGLKSYTVLVKRTNQPMDEAMVDKIIERQMGQIAEKIGVIIESSYYVHGDFDWLMYITAESTKEAKKFCEMLNVTYNGTINDIKLLETLFTVQENGIENPDISKLKEFFVQ